MDEFFEYVDWTRIAGDEGFASLYEVFSGKKISLEDALPLTQIMIENKPVIICSASDLYSVLDLGGDFRAWLGQCIAMVGYGDAGIERHVIRFITNAFGMTTQRYWFSVGLAKELVLYWGSRISSLFLSFYLAQVVDKYEQAVPNVAIPYPESGYKALKGVRPYAIEALAIQLGNKLSKKSPKSLGDFICDSVCAHFGVRFTDELKEWDLDLAWAMVEMCEEFFSLERYSPSWKKMGLLTFAPYGGDFVISHPAMKRHR